MLGAIWTQTLVLAITGVIVLYYAMETAKTRREITRQNLMVLRPVIVLDFYQDSSFNRALVIQNIGNGAAFNIDVEPLNIVPDTTAWDIHFDKIDFLKAHGSQEIKYVMPTIGHEGHRDRGSLFFPQETQKTRRMRIRYEDVEGGRYEVELGVYPRDAASSKAGYVSYSPIQKL